VEGAPTGNDRGICTEAFIEAQQTPVVRGDTQFVKWCVGYDWGLEERL